MRIDTTLQVLMECWLYRLSQGVEHSPEEMCAAHPEYLDELRKQIRQWWKAAASAGCGRRGR
jgi:hypothetical protein